MVYSRHIVLALLFSLVFSSGCVSSRNSALWDPVARSGASSEEIWYQYGGARVAYTAVPRPKQLYAGYGVVRDPAQYAQAPAITRGKKASPKRSQAKVPRPPDCPPCPPTDADVAKNTPGAASSASPSPATAPGNTGFAAPPPNLPPMLLPAPTPAPAAPNAPGA